jgi:DEAD/DEAH box helicase domain-containing protein
MTNFKPFEHQKLAYDVVVNQQKSLYLIAGTASGKTLAIALPLFHLLQKRLIHQVLFMYPTLALLDDQRRVMEKLAKITNFEIAEIKGGMKHSEIIQALNKPIILATPDSIYWFFRKNVKYSSLLIYGLAQVDAFVLDEAHLFNGLMLRNMMHLKNRIQTLAEQIGRRPQWHVLTATPHVSLQALTTNGVEIFGKSKCGPVGLTLLAPKEKMQDARAQMVSQVNSVLSEGAEKILLVFNSAATAHTTFNDVGKGAPVIPPHMYIKYGQMRWQKLVSWIRDMGLADDAQQDVIRAFYQHESVTLNTLASPGALKLQTSSLISAVSDLLEHEYQILSSIFNSSESDAIDWQKDVDAKIQATGKVTRQLFASVSIHDTKQAFAGFSSWVNNRIVQLEEIWSDDSVSVTTPNAPQLADALELAGFPKELADIIWKWLLQTIKVDGYALINWGHIPSSLGKRKVHLSWVLEQIQNDNEKQYLKELLDEKSNVIGSLVEFNYIQKWDESGLPVILYTGKMNKREREGLIEIFDKLPRAILISTSAVEVGVDFSADVLITEQCPGPGLLQRFGRIGRRTDIQGRVILQVHDRQVYTKLRQKLAKTLSREEFSEIVTEIFPPSRHITGSSFLDATHWIINEQIGKIGEILNAGNVFDAQTEILARHIRDSGINFTFGLRGTMPQVSLQEGIGLSPFYALCKIENEKLYPSDSPFDIAQTDMRYNSFIYEKSEWKIFVDWERTLENGQAMFYKLNNTWKVVTGNRITSDYLKSLSSQRTEYVTAFIKAWESDPDKARKALDENKKHKLITPLANLGEAIQIHNSPMRKLILGYGDVFLNRLHKGCGQISVKDNMENLVKIPNQIWLIFLGNKTDSERRLQDLGLTGIEELYLDTNEETLVLLEEMAGACFDVYERWNNNVA